LNTDVQRTEVDLVPIAYDFLVALEEKFRREYQCVNLHIRDSFTLTVKEPLDSGIFFGTWTLTKTERFPSMDREHIKGAAEKVKGRH
jgi:hypothetical protein